MTFRFTPAPDTTGVTLQQAIDTPGMYRATVPSEGFTTNFLSLFGQLRPVRSLSPDGEFTVGDPVDQTSPTPAFWLPVPGATSITLP